MITYQLHAYLPGCTIQNQSRFQYVHLIITCLACIVYGGSSRSWRCRWCIEFELVGRILATASYNHNPAVI